MEINSELCISTKSATNFDDTHETINSNSFKVVKILHNDNTNFANNTSCKAEINYINNLECNDENILFNASNDFMDRFDKNESLKDKINVSSNDKESIKSDDETNECINENKVCHKIAESQDHNELQNKVSASNIDIIVNKKRKQCNIPYNSSSDFDSLYNPDLKIKTKQSLNNNFLNPTTQKQSLQFNSFLPENEAYIFSQTDYLIRSSSNASSTSSSICSSSSSISSNETIDNLSIVNENHLKALIMSATLNSSTSNKNEDSITKNLISNNFIINKTGLISAYADQFSEIVKPRSNSISESNICSINKIDLVKQMISAYQTTFKTQNINSYQHTLIPSFNRKSVSSVHPNTNNPKSESKPDEFMVKNKNGEISNQALINSCKVCGDEASGFHYGVDSCEGCKGFFRRCITQGMSHQCTNNQQCEMTPFSRNSCQFCRLKKCFSVGMSREASRLGRRPKRPKDELLNDVTCTKQSIFEEKNSNNESQISCPSSPTLFFGNKTIETQPTQSEEIFPDNQNSKSKNPAPFNLESNVNGNLVQISIENKFTQASDIQNIKNLSKSENLSLINEDQNQLKNHLAPINFSILNENQSSIMSHYPEIIQENIQQIEILTKLISISDKYISIERTNELEYIRSTIIDSHLKTWPTTFEKIKKRYLERPPTKVSSPYQTNLNLDNFINSIMPLIMDVVKFCKQLPGFNKISQHDQVQLLRQGSFEVICVNSLMLVDAQNRLMLTPDMEFLIDQKTIKLMPLGFFMSEIFDLRIQVSSLELNDSELAIFNALLIMNPDREDLQEKDHIEENQATFLHVLYKHFKHYKNDGCDQFYNLLKLIPKIKEINRKHSEALNTINIKRSNIHSNNTPQNDNMKAEYN